MSIPDIQQIGINILSGFSETVQRLEEEVSNIWAEISTLQESQNYQSKEDNYADASATVVADLQEQKSGIETNITSQQETISGIETQIDAQDTVITTATNALNSLSEPVKSDYASSSVDAEGNEITTYPGYDDAKTAYDAKVAEYNQQINEAEAEKERLNEELEEANETLNGYETELSNIDTQIESVQLEDSSESDNTEDDSTQQKIADLGNDYDTKNEELSDAKAEEADAQAEAADAQAEAADAATSAEACTDGYDPMTVNIGGTEYTLFIDNDEDGKLSNYNELIGSKKNEQDLYDLDDDNSKEISYDELANANVAFAYLNDDGDWETMTLEQMKENYGDISISDINSIENSNNDKNGVTEVGTFMVNYNKDGQNLTSDGSVTVYDDAVELADKYGIDITIETDDNDEIQDADGNPIEDAEITYHGDDGTYTYDTEDGSYEVKANTDDDGNIIGYTVSENKVNDQPAGYNTEDNRIQYDESGNAYVVVDEWGTDSGDYDQANDCLSRIIDNSYDWGTIETQLQGSEYKINDVKEALRDSIIDNENNNIKNEGNLIYTGDNIYLTDVNDILTNMGIPTLGSSSGTEGSSDSGSADGDGDEGITVEEAEELAKNLAIGEGHNASSYYWASTDFSEYSEDDIAKIALAYDEYANEYNNDNDISIEETFLEKAIKEYNAIEEAASTEPDTSDADSSDPNYSEQLNTIVTSLVSYAYGENTDGESSEDKTAVAESLKASINSAIDSENTALLDAFFAPVLNEDETVNQDSDYLTEYQAFIDDYNDDNDDPDVGLENKLSDIENGKYSSYIEQILDKQDDEDKQQEYDLDELATNGSTLKEMLDNEDISIEDKIEMLYDIKTKGNNILEEYFRNDDSFFVDSFKSIAEDENYDVDDVIEFVQDYNSIQGNNDIKDNDQFKDYLESCVSLYNRFADDAESIEKLNNAITVYGDDTNYLSADYIAKKISSIYSEDTEKRNELLTSLLTAIAPDSNDCTYYDIDGEEAAMKLEDEYTKNDDYKNVKNILMDYENGTITKNEAKYLLRTYAYDGNYEYIISDFYNVKRWDGHNANTYLGLLFELYEYDSDEE